MACATACRLSLISILLLPALTTELRAQARSLETLLVIARRDSWQVRVSTVSDTTTGVIRSVFRDTAHIGRIRIPIATITRLERRKGSDWILEWPRPRQEVDSTAGSVNYLGPAAHAFAGPVMLLFPIVHFAVPPPIVGGFEVAMRGEASETTVTGRTIVYPFPFVLFAFDAGKNFFHERLYSGLAVGGIFSFEEGSDFAFNVGARVGTLADRGGGRGELRADAVLIQGEIGILLSGTIGFSRSRLQ